MTTRNPFDDLDAAESSAGRVVFAARPVTVIGTGISHPEEVLRIGDLEAQLKSFDRERAKMSYEEFAQKYMGGETVYIDRAGRGVAHYMVEAAQRSLDRAGVDAADIGSVVVSTSCSPDPIAGVRGLVLGGLGMYEKHSIELNSACTGFLDALGVGKDRAQATGDLVLVVAGDTVRSSYIDPEDVLNCGLMGDGASAAVVGPSEPGFGLKLGRTVTNADWRGDAIRGANGYFQMNAKALGVRIPAAFSEQFTRGCKRNGFDPQTTVAIPHQANGNLLKVLREKLGIDPRNLVNVFHKYGNCANASIGLALHHAFRDGHLTRGTNAVLFGAGAGFNFGYLGFTADRELPEQVEYRVLFVDDNRDLVEGMVREMTAFARQDEEFRRLFSFKPLIEYRGQDGLQRMIEDRAIGLVVTDQRMEAEMSGSAMVETLKRRARNIGYVLVTGFAEQDRAVIEKAGFNEVIQKPYDPAHLWSVLKRGAETLRNRDVRVD